jgi:DNA-binding Lrp family transcriptional regulator
MIYGMMSPLFGFLYCCFCKLFIRTELKRGQYLRSYSKLAEDLEYKEKRGFKKVSKSTVLRSVKKLIDEGIVSVTETDYGTIFTILKYHEYQGFDDDNETLIETDNEPLSEGNRNEIETLSKQQQELKNLRIKELNTSTKDPVDVIAERFIDLRTAAEGRSVYPTTKDYEAMPGLSPVVCRCHKQSNCLNSVLQNIKNVSQMGLLKHLVTVKNTSWIIMKPW